MKKRFKLTPISKILIGVLVVALAVTGVWKAGLFDGLGDSKEPTNSSNSTTSNTQTNSNSNTVSNTNNTSNSSTPFRISMDEWIGWKPIIDANGGLKTAPGSLMAQKGLDVEIVIINDGTQSSNALIKGDLAAAGYTINRTAFLMDKFENAGVDVVMPYISNYSNGGDGVIAKSDIHSVNDLVGRKVGIPRYSEAQTLVEWIIQKSDLTDAEIAQIEMVFFDTPDDVAKAFFAGKIDAGATWQPYLTQATETAGAHVLFSTKSATNLILDGMLFRQDFVDANRADVIKFIDACLESYNMYTTEFSYIKSAMPLFAMETDSAIKDMAGTADLAGYADNVSLLDGLAKEIYVDMSEIWNIAGTKMNENIVTHPNRTDIFDSSLIKELSDKYSGAVVENKVVVTETDRQTAQSQSNTSALLQKNVVINFEPNAATFLNPEEAMSALNEFVNIAQTLNGAIIQIEGNVADVGWGGDNTASQLLSEQRAQTVAKYLAQNGVDPNRFIVVGNGTSKPIADNSTEAGAAQNRRTDIYFKIVE